jgi:dTDP-4-amino-4,6-dideoxygalactose transaminase
MEYPKWRPELDLLKASGYSFSDPSEVVGLFEKKIAEWTGAPLAVAVDCATHAIELSLRFTGPWPELQVPKHTYLSIPQTAKKLASQVVWSDEKWQGVYQLTPSPVVDASLRLSEGMYEAGTLTCLSFQIKKHLPIGRGGIILTDDVKAYDWLKKAAYDGRTPETVWKTDTITQVGYHYYMTPEDAARGLLLFDHHFTRHTDLGGYKDYPDLTEMEYFKRINEWS